MRERRRRGIVEGEEEEGIEEREGRKRQRQGGMEVNLPIALKDKWGHILYSTYYKPMGDLPYISSEQGGGLIIHHGLIIRITIYKHPIVIQEL